MASLFYYITSDRYDKEDGPHDCQLVRFFHDKEHWQRWMADPLTTSPADVFECNGGRALWTIRRYLEFNTVEEDAKGPALSPSELIKKYLTDMNMVLHGRKEGQDDQ